MADDTAQTATIIAFPARKPTETAIPVAEGNERLRRALATLAAALAEQRESAQALKRSLGDLRCAVQTLGHSLSQYHDRLDKLRGQVGTLHSQSARLSEISAPAPVDKRA